MTRELFESLKRHRTQLETSDDVMLGTPHYMAPETILAAGWTLEDLIQAEQIYEDRYGADSWGSPVPSIETVGRGYLARTRCKPSLT